ncbi:MAG TPA: hypothetical protein VM324_05565 [Egibacteraceae bacterium]|nr:hypothetical protein [Egibacteraceae bacterium]
MAAGVVGTLAMDLLWYRRYRKDGGTDGFTDWELATSTNSFDDAAAPGKAGKKIADVVGVDLPDESAGVTTNVMHWLTGVGYGLGHGLLHHRRSVLVGGLATGTGAFANSYVTLGALGIYKPVWEYDRDTLLKDLSAHLVFGFATSVAYRMLVRATERLTVPLSKRLGDGVGDGLRV